MNSKAFEWQVRAIGEHLLSIAPPKAGEKPYICGVAVSTQAKGEAYKKRLLELYPTLRYVDLKPSVADTWLLTMSPPLAKDIN